MYDKGLFFFRFLLYMFKLNNIYVSLIDRVKLIVKFLLGNFGRSFFS